MLVSYLLSNPSTLSQSDPASAWYTAVLPIADRFFALSETFDHSATGRTILAMLASLHELRVEVGEISYPQSLCKPRAHLLSAMEATLYAITEALIGNQQNADTHRHKARGSLRAFRRRLAYLDVE